MSRSLATEAGPSGPGAGAMAYHAVSEGDPKDRDPLMNNEDDDDDEPKSHWLKVPMSKTSALSVTENFVKKSNWFRSRKQRQLLEQMAQPQPLTGNIYRYMAALVNVAMGQDSGPDPTNPTSDVSSGCCSRCSCCSCSNCCGCCHCGKCISSSWWRLTPGQQDGWVRIQRMCHEKIWQNDSWVNAQERLGIRKELVKGCWGFC